MLAEAYFRKGDAASARAAYADGISLNIDHLNTDYTTGVPAPRLITTAAKAAFPAWAAASPQLRSDVLRRAGDLLLARNEDLGLLLAREEGKILPEAIAETRRATGEALNPAHFRAHLEARYL